MRGKAALACSCPRGIGITPACAGKRKFSYSSSSRRWDHPRVCGEKTIRRHKRLIQKGSPPRVRGKARATSSPPYIYRITPACAGKSISPIHRSQAGQDHPRVCGEKLVETETDERVVGSPPRVRGKAHFRQSTIFVMRITPACAGKRVTSIDAGQSLADHPRVCGEKGHRTGSGCKKTGITPACAGKRHGCSPASRTVKDHPRVCGEKWFHLKSSYSRAGSPPRVRGKVEEGTRGVSGAGITPACAGKRPAVSIIRP